MLLILNKELSVLRLQLFQHKTSSGKCFPYFQVFDSTENVTSCFYRLIALYTMLLLESE